MSNARKREQHRLKRKKLAQQRRRESSISPAARYAKLPVAACYVASDGVEKGMGELIVLRQSPGGKIGMAMFLIDFWCCGVKIVWGRVDMTSSEFASIREKIEGSRGTTLRRVELADAQKLFASAARFGERNGFRHPDEFDRWSRFVGEWQSITPDFSVFGLNGELHWVGPMDDLKARLIGSTVEAFKARPDVKVIIPVGPDMEFEDYSDEDWDNADGTEDDDDLDEADADDPADRDPEEVAAVLESLKKVGDALLTGATKFLETQDETPSPLLDRVAQASAVQGVLSLSKMPADQADDIVQKLLQTPEGHGEVEMTVALDQLSRFKAHMRARKAAGENVSAGFDKMEAETSEASDMT